MENIYKINVPLAAASYQAMKKPLDLIFDGVMAIYPELDCMQLYSILRKIKEENNNTLKDLSMHQILDQVAELKGNYFFTSKREKGKMKNLNIEDESFYILINFPLLEQLLLVFCTNWSD